MIEQKKDLKDILKIMKNRLAIDFTWADLAIDQAEKFEKEFIQLGALLVFLYLDLNLDPYIKNKYISDMEDGYAKDTALRALKVAEELAEV
jgi:hypothetical protein